MKDYKLHKGDTNKIKMHNIRKDKSYSWGKKQTKIPFGYMENQFKRRINRTNSCSVPLSPAKWSLSALLTFKSRSLILVPCVRSCTVSSLRSFKVKSRVFLVLCVRKEAQIALYKLLLSSVGWSLGLLITPTRLLELLDFCKRKN